MRILRSFRGFGTGMLVGVLLGSAGMAAASFGYQGWTRFNDDFRVGFITGFLEMATLARNLEPGGWVDMRYPDVPQARPVEWFGVVDEIYKDPAHQGYTILTAMQLAATTLEKKYGKAEDPHVRARRRMEQKLADMRARQEKALREKGIDPKTYQQPLSPREQEVAKAEASEPAKPREKKWCRCDGTDPKKARAERRAKAAAEEKLEEEQDAATNPAKTAPAQAPAKEATTPPARPSNPEAPAKP